jgi:carbonic anhydrase
MNSLMDGYQRFRAGYWRTHADTFSTLAREGQSPPAMVIACADSRVSPEMIFDCAPGEIFVVRNVANLVPPYAPDTGNHGTSAALEFAVTGLNVRGIVVMGHSGCGGIRALVQGEPERGDHAPSGDFIASWMAIAEPARRLVCDAPDAPADEAARCAACELASIRVSLANLMTFPWIATRVAAGTLTLSGLHFEVETGQLRDVALQI